MPKPAHANANINTSETPPTNTNEFLTALGTLLLCKEWVPASALNGDLGPGKETGFKLRIAVAVQQATPHGYVKGRFNAHGLLEMIVLSADGLAKVFSDLLLEVIGKSKLRKVVKGNLVEAINGDSEICHSHDFCDANQVMIDAMDRFGLELDVQSESQTNLINAAWAIAKAKDFFLPPA